MGKPFTNEEREVIKEKLIKAGLKLFAEKGFKGVSIREITTEANISQGSFYNFYTDKEDFMIALMELRIRQKLKNYESQKEDSLEDPIKFLSDILYKEGMHLKDNKSFNNGISGAIEFLYTREKAMKKELGHHYLRFLEHMIDYWRSNGYRVTADMEGLMSVIRAAGILFSNADLMPEKYFAIMYRTFCDEAPKKFLEVDHE